MFFNIFKGRDMQYKSSGPVQQKESNISKFYKDICSFIELIKKLLKDTVMQQNRVNNQHDDLANLTEKSSKSVKAIIDHIEEDSLVDRQLECASEHVDLFEKRVEDIK